MKTPQMPVTPEHYCTFQVVLITWVAFLLHVNKNKAAEIYVGVGLAKGFSCLFYPKKKEKIE